MDENWKTVVTNDVPRDSRDQRTSYFPVNNNAFRSAGHTPYAAKHGATYLRWYESTNLRGV